MAFKMHDDARTTLEPKTPESNKSVLGIGHQQITRTPEVQIPQIMERPMRLLVPIGRVTTTRARLPEVVATVGDDLGLWQVGGCGDPGAWVGSVLTWTVHRVALLAQRFGPELYAKRLRGATQCSRYSLKIYYSIFYTTGIFLSIFKEMQTWSIFYSTIFFFGAGRKYYTHFYYSRFYCGYFYPTTLSDRRYLLGEKNSIPRSSHVVRRLLLNGNVSFHQQSCEGFGNSFLTRNVRCSCQGLHPDTTDVLIVTIGE